MDSNIIKYILLIFLFSFKVSAVEFNGKFIQGHFIIGKTDPSSKVKIDKKQIRVSKDGYFAFGISRDRKYDAPHTPRTWSTTLPFHPCLCLPAPSGAGRRRRSG